MKVSKKSIVDTNVPKTANKSLQPDLISDKHFIICIMNCIELIDQIIQKGGLVIDAGDEIFDEYRQQLSMSGQPGVGDRFMKWVHDNRWKFPNEDRVPITKINQSYQEFPEHIDLKQFDLSDRKFIAVANNHPDKPPVYQATDSKWLGWSNALKECGIHVNFLCVAYIKSIYDKKVIEKAI
jgi:hypothetical protein